jgi:hypothetical protein
MAAVKEREGFGGEGGGGGAGIRRRRENENSGWGGVSRSGGGGGGELEKARLERQEAMLRAMAGTKVLALLVQKYKYCQQMYKC